MKIRCIETPGSRKSRFVLVVGHWPERVLRHRGWSVEADQAFSVYERKATPKEVEAYSSAYRNTAYRAKDWDELKEIEHEVMIDADMAKGVWWEELLAAEKSMFEWQKELRAEFAEEAAS